MFQYYYTLLNSKDRQVYDDICRAFQNESLVVHTSLHGMTKEKLSEIVNAVRDDHPEFAFCHWSVTYSGSKLEFEMPFVNVYKNCSYRSQLKAVQRQISARNTEYGKEKFIHDYIVQHVDFDHDEITDNSFSVVNHTVEGALKQGKAVCEGIARFAQLLLLLAGLKAIYVSGTSRSFAEDEPGGHAWVIVYLEGDYYHLDVSHDICLKSDKRHIRYNYFNLTDDEILHDHAFEHPEKLYGLACRSVKYNYFNMYDMYFMQTFEIYVKTLSFLRTFTLNQSQNTLVFKVSSNITENSVMENVKKAMNVVVSESGKKLECSVSEVELQNVYSFVFNI